MIVPTIGGIVAAHSVMWHHYGENELRYAEKSKAQKNKPNVQEKKPAPVVEYRNKNINRWAMKKPIVRRVA